MNTVTTLSKVKLFAVRIYSNILTHCVEILGQVCLEKKKTFGRINSSLPEAMRLPDDLANLVGDRVISDKERILFAKVQALKFQLLLQGRGSKYETLELNNASEQSPSNATPVSLPNSQAAQKSGFASKLEFAMLKTKENARIVFIKHITLSPDKMRFIIIH